MDPHSKSISSQGRKRQTITRRTYEDEESFKRQAEFMPFNDDEKEYSF